jgi:hypothetical protein
MNSVETRVENASEIFGRTRLERILDLVVVRQVVHLDERIENRFDLVSLVLVLKELDQSVDDRGLLVIVLLGTENST